LVRKAAVALIVCGLLTGCGATPAWRAGTASPQASGPRIAAQGTPQADRGGSDCQGFPADNIWRADVSKLPVHKSSAAYVNSIGAAVGMHADFGSGLWQGAPIGIPITAVKPGQAAVKVTFQYGRESDPGPYPIPPDPAIEGGPKSTGDRHIILHDLAACRVYELFAAYLKGGAWTAGSGAIFHLNDNKLRPAGWTSADAAGLSIFAGLVRYDEFAAGHIDHALRITAPRTRNAYVWPARHAASSSADAALPPMGLRLRLKASVDTSRLPQQARVIGEAMKRYGVILADNGSPWYLSGAPDERWSNDALRALGGFHGGDFEAVDVSGLMLSADSGAVKPILGQ
jgi:hypothetical protein